MTELIVAVVGVVGTFLTTRGWPTLARRIRDHTALLKDMPVEISDELRALLKAEVTEMVRRDKSRLDKRINTLLNIRLAGLLFAGALSVSGLIVAAVVTTAGQPGSISKDQEVPFVIAFVGSILVGTAVSGYTGYLASRAKSDHQRMRRLEEHIRLLRRSRPPDEPPEPKPVATS